MTVVRRSTAPGGTFHVKGSAVTARVRYVREHFGEAGEQKLLAALTPEHRKLVEQRILASAWTPYSLFIDLNVAADRLFAKGDLQLCFTMGKYSAEVNLPTIYKVFYRFGSPLFIFDKAASVWDVHYDSGRLVPVSEGPEAIRLRLEGFAEPHRAHCLSVLGWAAKSAELSGVEVIRAEEVKCRTKGDDACEHVLKWK